MKKALTSFLLALIFPCSLPAQEGFNERPKLVVGIVVDQMRQEYLYRFYNKFGEDGFKRLLHDGFVLKNAHYNYVPTVTGPGHASIYSGSTPAIHGIISNEWYDKALKKQVNCTEDPSHKPVGSEAGNGDVSPWRMLTTTITDELKLSSQKRSKVISISFKDRGAVLPAGHTPDGAYWYDSKTGRFITSTYYMNKLPEWVDKFNQLKLPDKFLAQEWKTLYPIEQYTESGPDDSPYEYKFKGKEKSTFPYNLKALRKDNDDYDLLSYTPFANEVLTTLAKAALDGEKLGTDEWTDFLTVSFSTTDMLGHALGPNAVEIEDMYLRLDRNLADLFKTLDEKLGENEYTVFLTADHGVAEVPQYLKDNKVPAGYFSPNNLKAKLNEFLEGYFPGKELIEDISNEQIFLNHDAFQEEPKSSGVEFLIATELITTYLMTVEGVASSYSESILRQGAYDEGGFKGMVVRGYHPKRSGDIAIVLEPGWFTWPRVQGSTHGSGYSYDTHVPVLFYGWGVKKGSSVAYHRITDIAPTLSVLLKIKFPNGCTGQPIGEMFDK